MSFDLFRDWFGAVASIYALVQVCCIASSASGSATVQISADPYYVKDTACKNTHALSIRRNVLKSLWNPNPLPSLVKKYRLL